MSFYRPPAFHEALEAIGSIYRSFRALQFYPTGHPARKSTLIKAHSAMREILGDNNLSLVCGRTAFSLPDGEILKDSSKLCSSLSNELFIRRVKTITFLCDLKQEDLLDLVRILTILPNELQLSGGIEELLEQHGVTTIWVNEFDLAIIHGRRQHIEAQGVIPRSLDELESGTDNLFHPTSALNTVAETTNSPEEDLSYLTSQLLIVRDDDRYLILVRQAVTCADLLLLRRQPELILPLIELLSEQTNDTKLGYFIQQNASFAIENLATEALLVLCVLKKMEQVDGVSINAASTFLQAAGVHAIVPIVEAIGNVTSLSLRKNLNSILEQMGDDAVPTLLSQMDDVRWYIIRNLCAVLGSIGNIAAVPQLLKCLTHADLRVCKEAVRSLAKIGGSVAESALITLLKQKNTPLLSQVIASLAGMKSHKAVLEFLAIVFGRDLFLKTVAIKCEALAAIAIVGDSKVAPQIAKLLDAGFFMAGKRTLQLKIAAVECLGKLCNSDVIPILEKHAQTKGELGKVCSSAIETLGSRTCQMKSNR